MVDPKYKLPVIEVPGLAEARQREHDLRNLAFLPIGEEIAGIPVKAYTPYHLLALDAVKNGFVVPCTFERESERAAHALQFLWFVSTEYRIPTGKLDTLWMRWRRYRFTKRTAKVNAFAVFDGIAKYLDEALMDCPGSSQSNSGVRQVGHASFMASIVDMLYGAGYPWSEAEILNTPFRRIWQYLRLSMKRLDPECTLSNPSDRLASAYIAKLNAETPPNV